MSAVRPYRGVSAEERRADRRARLVQACLDVIGRAGIAGATVDAVCAEAGLSKRYFYEGFADRDALLVEVIESRLYVALAATIRGGLAQGGTWSVFERARFTVEKLLEAMDDPRIARLYVEAPGWPALQPRRMAAYEDYARLWVVDVLRRPAPGPRAHLGALVFISGTTQAVINWLDGTVELAREELVDELAVLGTEAASSVAVL